MSQILYVSSGLVREFPVCFVGKVSFLNKVGEYVLTRWKENVCLTMLTSYCLPDIIMEQYIKIMNEDDDKDTVSQVCSCTADVLKSVTYESVEKCKCFPLCLLRTSAEMSMSWRSQGRLA